MIRNITKITSKKYLYIYFTDTKELIDIKTNTLIEIINDITGLIKFNIEHWEPYPIVTRNDEYFILRNEMAFNEKMRVGFVALK